MKFVVKLGGATLENPEVLHQCARAIAELVKDGNQVVLTARTEHGKIRKSRI